MAINFDLNDLLAFRAVAEMSNFRCRPPTTRCWSALR
jgi:hypothetical protein